MENEFVDQEDTISIWRLMSQPLLPADDPRYISRDLRDQIVRHRLAQMRREAEENVAVLREARARDASSRQER